MSRKLRKQKSDCPVTFQCVRYDAGNKTLPT